MLLEVGRRHPSKEIIGRLAGVLALNRSEFFFNGNPRVHALVKPLDQQHGPSAWERFRSNAQLRRFYRITNEGMELLSCAALLGDARSPHAFLYILITVRYAVGCSSHVSPPGMPYTPIEKGKPLRLPTSLGKPWRRRTR